MSLYLLLYDVVDDYVERRSALRADHLALARAARERGELLMGGAIGEPVDGAVLLFDVADASVVERFARADPYVVEGLVTRWRTRVWHEVLRDEVAADEPPRPIEAGSPELE